MFRAKHPRRGVLALLASPLLALIPRKAGADMPEPYSAYADQYSGNGSPASAPPNDDTGGITPGTLIERLERIERWMAMHGGNIGAANAQYPHPYQSVTTLEFGNGVGQLSPLGIQLVTPTAVGTPAVIWTPELLGDNDTVVAPYAYLTGYALASASTVSLTTSPVGGSEARITHSVVAGTAATTTLQVLGGGETGTVQLSSASNRASLKLSCLLNLGSPSTETIASGVITIAASSNLLVDTESSAASDDLDTISGGSSGDVIMLRAANSARTVVLKNGTGNLSLGGDITLDHADDAAALLYTGSVWVCLTQQNNNA